MKATNAKLVQEARERAHTLGDATSLGSLLDELADALEAATTPRTVANREEAEAEPFGTVFGHGIMRVFPGEPVGLEWGMPGDPIGLTAGELPYPLAILYTPSPEPVENASAGPVLVSWEPRWTAPVIEATCPSCGLRTARSASSWNGETARFMCRPAITGEKDCWQVFDVAIPNDQASTEGAESEQDR